MGYQKKSDLSTETAIQLGGTNKKTGKPNPKFVEGYYLGSKTTQSDFGEGKLHVFQTAEGNVGVWGKTNSNRLLASEHLGQMVKLSFTGMGKAQKGRAAPYNYELLFDADNTIAVASDSAESFGQEEAASDDTGSEEVDYSQDEASEESTDEAPPARPVMPKRAAATPSPEARAKVQALLNSRKVS